jgi:hypothetical protein
LIFPGWPDESAHAITLKMQKPRDITNPAISRESPAWRVIVIRFEGLARFCAACGIASSTAYDWLLKGLIPADRVPRIKRIAIELKIPLERGDFEPAAEPEASA